MIFIPSVVRLFWAWDTLGKPKVIGVASIKAHFHSLGNQLFSRLGLGLWGFCFLHRLCTHRFPQGFLAICNCKISLGHGSCMQRTAFLGQVIQSLFIRGCGSIQSRDISSRVFTTDLFGFASIVEDLLGSK